MCGHVGVAGNLEFRDEPLMKRLLVFDYFRGTDSTGLAVLKKNGEYGVAKAAVGPIDLFDMKKFESLLKGSLSTVFLGHNRAATKGIVNNVNAHPYEFPKADGQGTIVGAHNGTLDQAPWMEIEKAVGEEFTTDSMAVIASIAKLGIDKTVSMMRGAWALVWFDTETKELFFLRNKERPFWYSYTESFDRVMWASEYPIIQAAVELSGQYQGYKLYTTQEGYKYFATAENYLYRFNIDELRLGSTTMPEPRIREIKGKEPLPAVQYACGGVAHFPNHSTHGKSSSTVINHTTSSTTGTASASNISKFPHLGEGNWQHPFKDFLTAYEFDIIAAYGCSWCGEDVDFTDEGIQVAMHQHNILCKSCFSDDVSRLLVA